MHKGLLLELNPGPLAPAAGDVYRARPQLDMPMLSGCITTQLIDEMCAGCVCTLQRARHGASKKHAETRD